MGGIYGITTGDVNGDGKTDLIYWLNGGPGIGLNVRVKMSNGDGTFTGYSQQLGDTVMELSASRRLTSTATARPT